MSDREQKYADAVRGAWTTFEAARAVMAVADAEQAELRAEVERLRRDVRGQTKASQRAWRVADIFRERIKTAEAERDALRAQVERVEALIAPGVTPDGEELPPWVHTDEIARALSSSEPVQS